MIRVDHDSQSPTLIVCLLLFAALSASAAAQNPRPLVQEALSDLELAIGGPVEAEVSPITGLVSFLSFSPNQAPITRASASESAVERALSFLDEYGNAFAIQGRRSVSVTRVSDIDEVGMEHVRFRQTHQRVPVASGELTVHLLGDAIVAVNAKTLTGLDQLVMTPTVDPVVAAAEALLVLEGRLGVVVEELSEPRLEVFNRGLLESRRGFSQLAWFIEATAPELREFIWVDAVSGSALFHYSQLTNERQREIYDAEDPTDGVYGTYPGVLVRSEGDAATGDADTDDAYDYSGDTYDYFLTEHGRDSYDDAGAPLISTVHYCPSAGNCPYVNAFWTGSQMVYGEGFSAADDVDGHELAHAVTEFTAGLRYYMQSGALNESFSDIFGETVDLTNSGGTDTPSVKWLMGEDVPVLGALRDMMDPTAFGDPGKMSDAQFVCGDPGGDSGGVHSNSGVPNHAYALMVDGGTYNGETVTGIGLTKAGKVQYRALSYYLLSASDFLDDYNALNQSCEDLIGTADITAADCVEVGTALDAVEMSDTWPCAVSQAAPPDLCPVSQAPTLWFTEDFETSTFGTCWSEWCSDVHLEWLGPYATSGIKSAWAYTPSSVRTSHLVLNPSGTLPSSARMQFNHSYGFDNSGTTYYDGGVIAYSTDGGVTWIDGGSLISSGQTYAGTIEEGWGNPLSGLSAFGGDSWGYTTSQLDLSTAAGATFSPRFTIGTDSGVDDYGWWVDDVRIYTCDACVANHVLDDTYNGLASFYGASVAIRSTDGFVVGAMESVTLSAPTVRFDNGTEFHGDLTVVNATCP